MIEDSYFTPPNEAVKSRDFLADASIEIFPSPTIGNRTINAFMGEGKISGYHFYSFNKVRTLRRFLDLA